MHDGVKDFLWIYCVVVTEVVLACSFLCMWNCSSVFKCGPFVWCRIICMIDSIGPKG
jgi:hypothetical protein